METSLSIDQTAFTSISILGFAINLLIGLGLLAGLAATYVIVGKSLSNRKLFAGNFIFLGLIVLFIITVVKSSLALSLGLVGALSIVRFRTPIKEPSELLYLFASIAIGLGLGADQRLVTVIFTLFALAYLWIGFALKEKDEMSFHGTFLTIASGGGTPSELNKLLEIAEMHLNKPNVVRIDEHQVGFTLHLNIEEGDLDSIRKYITSARQVLPDLTVSLQESLI
jgi:hypothetical protein